MPFAPCQLLAAASGHIETLGKQFSVAQENYCMFPTATYRLQLHHQFRLKEVRQILDYLQQLGIDTVYASPIFAAVPGSLHGYDVTNPHIINPEIGSDSQFREIIDQLSARKMRWLQDIVPNHMAFDSRNEWLMDVLERGEFSEYANFFDINWKHPDEAIAGKLMVPFLGDELETCLQKKEIQLQLNDEGLSLSYFETSWPLSVSAYDVLIAVLEQFEHSGKTEIRLFSEHFSVLVDQAQSGISLNEWRSLKEKWVIALHNHSVEREMIVEVIEKVNNDPALLEEIIDSQYYLPCCWRETEKRINYRRFFTVNGLICLRMEDEKVYRQYHQYIHDLYGKGYFNGLRIDHIDGLYDPKGYIEQLRNSVGDKAYIIAEKILEPNEELPADWKSQGTSGYEFLSHISRLLTHVEGAQQLETYYKNQIAGKKNYQDVVFEKKHFILVHHMRGELNNLIAYLHELNLLPGEESTDERLLDALAVFMAAFPVYRIYPDAFPIDNLAYADKALQISLQKKPSCERELKWIRSLFDAKTSIEAVSSELLFLKRLMQFTGPLAAKGVEDTAFYSYNPLISHNEVGDAPGKLAISSSTFHRQMLSRLSKTRFSLNATSTHDTKRGEDARARINVLSEMPEEWINAVEEWRKMNMDARKKINGKLVPGTNEEYFIYQSMIGGFPPDLNVREDDVSRLKEYVQKFLREEKLYTDWSEPDEAYEQACFSFIDHLFDERNGFMKLFRPFVEKIIVFGSVYSLSQALIKVTAPGIPDVYQGAELWDLSYVDPDNRRPVDYELRKKVLQQIMSMESDKKKLLCFLANHRNEGYEKMYVLYKSLHFRKEHAELFGNGEYIPLEIEGGEQVAVSFARRWNNQWAIVVVPFGISQKMNVNERVPKREAWNDLVVKLPSNAPSQWSELFTGSSLSASGGLKLSEIFSQFPVALITASQ